MFMNKERSQNPFTTTNDSIDNRTRAVIVTTVFLTECSTNDKTNIFLDESGYNLHMRRNYGRRREGTRLSTVVTTVQRRNLTLLLALNSEGVIHFSIFQGSCNTQRFVNFLNELGDKLLRDHEIGDGNIFMVNARPHTSSISSENMWRLNTNTKYLSPYSFMLNPVEFTFSKIKNRVRSLLSTSEEDIGTLIKRAIGEISENDCADWFRLMRRNCALAMNKHYFN